MANQVDDEIYCVLFLELVYNFPYHLIVSVISWNKFYSILYTKVKKYFSNGFRKKNVWIPAFQYYVISRASSRDIYVIF